MANKLIEELIIKVKQQGAKPTEKALLAVTSALQEAELSAAGFNQELDEMPKYLQRVEKTAARTADQLSKVNLRFSSAAAEKSLSAIENGLEAMIEEAVETNDLLTKLNNNMIRSFENLATSLGSDLERVEDGLIDVRAQAGKTGEALVEVGKKAQRAGRGIANQNRQGRNSARTFSDLAKIAGPLPLLYANIAANAFALAEAFRLLSEGEQLNRLEQVGAIMGGQIGTPIQFIAREMQDLTGYTLSYGEAIRNAAAAASYGFDSKQIEQLTLAARRASIALGVDMQDAMNRVIRGTSKLEIELLDELGITTKLTTAYSNYARQIGVSADSLNSYQQRAALVAEINAQSVEKFGVLDSILRDGTPWEQFGANAATALQDFQKRAAEATSWLPEFFNKADELERRLQAPIKAATELSDSFAKATERGGMVGIIVEANTKLKDLEANLARLNSIPTAGMSISQMVQLKDEIQNTRRGIDILQEVLDNQAALGIPNIEKANEAYKNLTSAVRGTKQAYDAGLASVIGQSSGYEKLYNDVKSMVDAYDLLRKTDPGFDAAKSLRSLGFDSKSVSESEAALYSAQRLAKAYRDASAAIDLMESSQAAAELTARKSGLTEDRVKLTSLQAQLTAQQNLLKAQQALGVLPAKYAANEAQVYKLQGQILDARIAIVDKVTEQRTIEMELSRSGENEVIIKRQLIQLEKDRLYSLQMIEGSQEQQTKSLQQIKQLQNDIKAIQLAESMTIMDSALSNLYSYGSGIDQLTGSLNKLSLSFNNMGETSLTAMQLTSTGLQAFQGMLQYTTANTISAIDAQINAEQKRDGKSEQSLAKIKELEARKIKEQKKAAQQQILISTAVAVMNAAANPWPVPAIPLMAAAALAGGLAYQQASSASSNALAGLDTGASQAASLTVGTRDNKVDVSGAASRGELSYVRGEAGVGNISSFTPRAAGGVGYPGTGILVGENGPEVVSPLAPVRVTDAEDTANMMKGSNKQGSVIGSMVIQALDAQSIIDRAPDIYRALEYEAEQRGQSLERLSI